MIRLATTEDIPSIARLHIEGWKAAYGGLVDQAYLDSLSVEQRIKDWQGWMTAGESETLLAERDGQPAGFITYGRTKTAPPGSSNIRPTHSAEIYALYLHPDHWRHGIGQELLRLAAANLKKKKHSSLCLWVMDGNARAKSFYEKMGGQRIGKKMVEVGPSTLKELCYGWKETTNLVS
jgi:hypothetical protein